MKIHEKIVNKQEKENFLSYIKSKNEIADVVFINPEDLVFEQNVVMNCFYCGRYNNNWRCPPNLPKIDYKEMMKEFSEGAFVVLSYEINTKEEYSLVRNESSVSLHKLLLDAEKWMWNHNKSTALSFIGGSCKLCKGGCGKERCNNPYMSRSPLEATGCNVVKSAKKYGIDISFPTENKMLRLGLIVWQD